LTILLTACGLNPSDTEDKQTLRTEKFDDFFTKFTSDSVFQIKRIKFPLVTMISDNEDRMRINETPIDRWSHLNLDYKSEYQTRQIDAYTQEMRMFKDSVIIELRGIDNGIYIDYIFQKCGEQWYLILKRDFSS